MIHVIGNIWLDETELQEKFVRSSGPGGQNVNKVSTAVQLRFNAAGSPNLPPPVRARLLKLAGSKATTEGEIVLEAERYRTREQNRADALERLLDLVRRATVRPKPRRKTRPTRGSVERRLKNKKGRSTVKQGRRKVGADD
jgi:ribosome-associated protein